MYTNRSTGTPVWISKTMAKKLCFLKEYLTLEFIETARKIKLHAHADVTQLMELARLVLARFMYAPSFPEERLIRNCQAGSRVGRT
jgi:hypothetical protein